MIAKAARRYAHAFLETAIEQKSLEKAKDDMLFIMNTIRDSSELRLFVKSPIIKDSFKKSALEAIFRGKVQELTMALIGILCDKGRENLLFDITRGFIERYNAYHGIMEVHVAAASEFAENQKTRLIEKLESVSGKKINMDVHTDKSLIGGLTVRIEDTVIDGSVKHKLNQLKEQFTTATVE